MGNIRCRQHNVTNIQQLIPTCIEEFIFKCNNMMIAIEGLKEIELSSDTQVEEDRKTTIAADFDDERK